MIPAPCRRLVLLFASCVVLAIPTACAPRLGEPLARRGDEIVICGQYFHTGAPVVLWTDPGGYDAYRVERRFVPLEQAGWEATAGKIAGPNRFSLRRVALSDDEIEQVRGGGWSLDLLRRHVDQFVIHYDVCGTSRHCFKVLHDMRGLSVHFMLDIDGTIYQTLDVKERAWHATIANDRSVGIEIAHIGAYGAGQPDPFDRWYAVEQSAGPAGTTGFKQRIRITIPSSMGDGGVRTPDFVGYSAQDEMIVGDINGTPYRMYDFTPQQYESLARLTATLCIALPEIECTWPVDERGQPLARTLTPEEWQGYRGLLGHYHLQHNKVDPGPAFNFQRIIDDATRLMRSRPRSSQTVKSAPTAG